MRLEKLNTLHTGAIAVTAYNYGQFGADIYDATTISILPYILDDVGCSGSENNLLDCLPQHNCAYYYKNDIVGGENAGVQCLRKGIATCDQVTIASCI